MVLKGKVDNICKDLSVLMSVYHKERPNYLYLSIESIWSSQLLKPNKIILVKDGPLSRELDQVILKWKKVIKDQLQIITNEKNIGLAYALNIGLFHCEGEFIARMDSDDISLPNRFLQQFNFLINNQDIDVVGSALSEIDEHGTLKGKTVIYPLSHDQCFKMFKKRDPLAHPTVMFRKRYFDKAGLYDLSQEAKQTEDSYLWMKGFKKGCKFANLSEVLLYYRITNEFFGTRRGGVCYGIKIFKTRLRIIKELNYFIDSYVYAILLFVVYISPTSIKKLFYKLLR